MKILLSIILLITFIITACKQRVEFKTEKVGLTATNIDTIKTLDKTEAKKELEEYKTIQKPTVTKSDYIDFFKDVLNSDGLIINENIKIFAMEPNYWNSDLIKLTQKSNDRLSELIDLNDIKFIYEQTESQKNVFLRPTEIPIKKIEKGHLENLSKKGKDLEEFWNEIYKLGSGYYRLELPLFSIDKSVAFFRYSYYCGSLCANSGTYIFQKINGKWERIGNIGVEIVS